MSTCGGPIFPVLPGATCGSPNLPSLDIMDMFNAVPGKIHRLIQDAGRTNEFIARVVAYNDLRDLELEVDDAFVKGFNLTFDTVSAVWLVGCWPPQRYLVVNGVARLPRGRLAIRTTGLDIVVSFSDFAFRFNRLRAEVQCHGGSFVLQGMGTGQGKAPLSPSTLFVSGNITVECGRRWGPWCIALRAEQAMVTAKALAMIPDIVAWALSEAHPLPLGPGCPDLLHNTLAALAFGTKDCCEADYSADEDGTLRGGQFNGRVYGASGAAEGVECTYIGSGRWTVRCDSIPGGYYQVMGTCREDDTLPPPWKCPWCASAWDALRLGTRVALVLAALLLGLSVFGCCRCHGSCRKRSAAGDSDSASQLLDDDEESWSGH